MVRPFSPNERISDGVFLSVGERLQVRLKTGDFPRGRGFRAIYKTGESDWKYGNVRVCTLICKYQYDWFPNVSLDLCLRRPLGIGCLLQTREHQLICLVSKIFLKLSLVNCLQKLLSTIISPISNTLQTVNGLQHEKILLSGQQSRVDHQRTC